MFDIYLEWHIIVPFYYFLIFSRSPKRERERERERVVDIIYYDNMRIIIIISKIILISHFSHVSHSHMR